jgi:hypothetical protein
MQVVFEECFQDQYLWGNKGSRIWHMEKLICVLITALLSSSKGSFQSEMALRVVHPWGNRTCLLSWLVIERKLPLERVPALGWGNSLWQRGILKVGLSWSYQPSVTTRDGRTVATFLKERSGKHTIVSTLVYILHHLGLLENSSYRIGWSLFLGRGGSCM